MHCFSYIRVSRRLLVSTILAVLFKESKRAPCCKISLHGFDIRYCFSVHDKRDVLFSGEFYPFACHHQTSGLTVSKNDLRTELFGGAHLPGLV